MVVCWRLYFRLPYSSLTPYPRSALGFARNATGIPLLQGGDAGGSRPPFRNLFLLVPLPLPPPSGRGRGRQPSPLSRGGRGVVLLKDNPYGVIIPLGIIFQ